MIITKTPYRVSLFGGGTDYPIWFREHGGEVVSATIDKYCYISCRWLPSFFAHKYRFVYSMIEEVRALGEIRHPAIRGVLQWMDWKDGVEIHHDGDLPARSGIGSSSSFTVGLINALYAMQGLRTSKARLAREAIHVEQRVLHETVGCQDQVAAAYGGLNHVVFLGDDRFSVDPIILVDHRLEQLQSSLMLFFTGTTRTSGEIAAATLENFKSKKNELKKIHSFAHDAIELLKDPDGTIGDLGPLLHEAWTFKRSLCQQITNPTIDRIYELARRAGATGGKLLGAGGGGFMLFFVPPERQRHVREALARYTYVPAKFEHSGSTVALYQPEGL